ncbi:RNA dependent RNA polymerase P1-P2 fusion protein [Nectarine stem pitting associated virus]|uniref:RNA-directed RNA polymerase n=4 Tax=Nectarine stem pitting associated virus TaxID=2560614 RepID=A0A0G2URM2_9TOMB|nr:RNA dependent RNA polymerase P1-P2 fusion protein [Nectarine stem pitting associated virus]AKI33361.1 RNA dependent RNA polymerase P1-P2 fusion protein [Nectarine stem pitting associated virus]
MIFDLLISASTKAIKDFISFLYSKCRNIYCRFKKWLMDFSEYDAFVAECFETMFEVETFQEEVVDAFIRIEDELAAAEAKLKEVHNPYLWGKISEYIFPSRPEDVEVAKLQVYAKEVQMRVFIDDTLDDMEEAVSGTMSESQVEALALTPNQLKARLKKAAKHRRQKQAAKKMREAMDKVEKIAELSDWTTFEHVEVVDQKHSHPAREEQGEDGKKIIPAKIAEKWIWVRNIKTGEEKRARHFIRAYVMSKNLRLRGDDVSKVTIQRYVEQFCDANDFSLEAKTQLIKVALMMVPVPTKTEIDMAMVVHCPRAEALRHQLECIESRVFLDGLGSDSGFLSPFSLLGLPEIVVHSGAIPRRNSCNISFLTQLTLGLDYQSPSPVLHNALVAVERRVFTVGKGDEIVLPPQATRGIFGKLAYFRDRIVEDVGYCKTYSPMELASTYHSSKRAAYTRAVLSLRHSPVNQHDAQVTAFLKMEKHRMGVKAIAPRMIAPRSKRYNVELGRRLKFNEKKFMNAIDHVFGSKTVLSGYDNRGVGKIIASKWKKFQNPVAIGVDASRFDQHCSVEALKFEHSIYNAVFGDAELAQLLNWQLDNKMKMFVEDKILKYNVKGHRCSGDINTAMGNKLLMCAMMHNYFREIEVNAELCNNGDDCVIICERDDESKFSNIYNWFLDYGFNMVCGPSVYKLEELEFCQGKPVFINGRCRMVRKPDSMSKDVHSLLSMQNQEDVKSFMSATAQCGLVLNSGVPILEAFHRCLYRNSGYKKVSEAFLKRCISYGNDERLGGRRTAREEPVTLENRLSYWRSFGVDPRTQFIVEEYLDNLVIDTIPRGVKRLTPLLSAIVLNA